MPEFATKFVILYATKELSSESTVAYRSEFDLMGETILAATRRTSEMLKKVAMPGKRVAG
jgi:hypothetical protein